jgi:glycerate kinase
MKILIAPDKFKGSLSAREVAESIAAGLHDVLPDATLDIVPVADGGEGTADVIRAACAAEWVTCAGHDALGREITARYVWLGERMIAVMEMSETAGLWRIAPHERDPFFASTYGVGEMLLGAARRATNEVIVGLGGSATNDGGFGMARALGFRFLNSNGVELKGPVPDLLGLEHIASPPGLVLPRVTAAVDVRNPLLGARGATRTFGPQKGVASDQLEVFEEALARLADVIERDLGCDLRDAPGAGAAGGLGFGLVSFCGATLRPGFDLVAEMLDLGAAIQRADVVITGEGSLDDQTLEGKAPAGVARLARKLGKRVFAIVGCATEHATAREVFDGVFLLAQPPITREESMRRTAALLRERARELGATLIPSFS